MIVPTDASYISTREVMLGKQQMDAAFLPLAAFINERFGVRTINIIHDTIDDGKRPRLEICFEFEHERQVFYENGKHYNYDREKQQIIAEAFRMTMPGKAYDTGNIWVIFSAFEPIARIEANETIPQRDILQLQKELNHPDLWVISRSFSATTFFVYRDEQVKRYQDSETHRLWSDKYFDLLEAHDPFGYFKRETYRVHIDSKENFDTNYQSNWYYYYK